VTTTPCQRWRDRRGTYVPPSLTFNPARFGVEVIADDTTARLFVERHHYSGSYPAARCRVGLFDMNGFMRGALVGVAVFSVPMQQAVIPRWLNVDPAEGVELGRFVLLDTIAANAETWLLRQAFQALKAEIPTVRGVLAYSDPVPRRDVSGRLIMPGHIGTIYQAHNGRYLGRGSARTLLIDSQGRTISARMLSKIRADDQGWEYAVRELELRGAPPRQPGESGAGYLKRALPFVVAQRIRHPGNLAYAWPLGTRRERPQLPPSLPYPKQVAL